MAGFDVLRWRKKKDLPVPRQVFSATGREIDVAPSSNLGPALVRSPSGNVPRGAITASASVLPVGDRREAMRARYTRQGWQAEAFAYLDGVGELRYVVQTSANAISRLRLFPAVQLDPKEPPTPLDEVGTNDMPSTVVAAAMEDMDLLNEPGHGLTAMQHTQSINKQVVGEYYIVGLPHDPETGEESWSIRSIDEVVIDADGRYWLRDRPPGFQGYDELPYPLGDDCYIARCWDQHPRFRALAWSQLRPLLESLEELLLASRMIRATLRSRISGAGILLVPDELELLGINPTAQDAQASPFFEELTKAMLTPIQSEGDASEVVPVVVKGPAEILKELRHLTLDRPIDQAAMAIRGELIRRLAIGVDWPPELLLGVGDVSHWAQWFVDESTFRYHYEPQGISSVRQWTQGYASPMLRAREWDAAAAKKAAEVVWWYDPTELLTHPDRTKDAITLYGMDVLNDDALLRAAGFNPDTDKPTEAEFLVRLMSKFRSFPPNIVEAIVHRYDPSLEIPADQSEPGMGPGGTTDPTPTPGGGGGPPAAPDGGNPGRSGPPVQPDQAAITAAFNRLLGHRETITVRTAAAAVDNSGGAMVAFYPTPEQAAALALDDGESPETLHVTLAYLGSADELTPEQLTAAADVCTAISRLHAPLEGVYAGIARFTASSSSDGLDPVVALPDVQGLVSIRNMLCEHLAAAGVPLPSEHGFQPHTTLAYVEQGGPLPVDRLDEPVPASFGELSLVVGGNRTDFPLVGTAEPLVAAGPAAQKIVTFESLSRRLVDIDVKLRERIRTAADAALRRQLEKAAARLQSRLNNKPDLRAALDGVEPQDYASVLGQDVLAKNGIEPDMLLGNDFADLREKADAWIGDAQSQALDIAGRVVPLVPPTVDNIKQAQTLHRKAGVDYLIQGVTKTAAQKLFDPTLVRDPGLVKGEFDRKLLIDASIARTTVGLSGGYGDSDWLTPMSVRNPKGHQQQTQRAERREERQAERAKTEGAQGLSAEGIPLDAEEVMGGIGTGVVIRATLEEHGASIESWEWIYGSSVRSFEPHVVLDGFVYTSHSDERLTNTYGWPETEFFYPGDHDGCDCTESPTWGLRLTDEPTEAVVEEEPDTGVAASAAYEFNPDQARDEHGRFAPGGGGSETSSDGGGGGDSTAEKLAGEAEQGGFSWSPVTGSEPSSGYMIGGLAAPSEFPAGDRAAVVSGIQQFMSDHADYYAQNPTYYVGGWVQSNADGSRSLVVEPSENVSDRETAVRLGTERNQVSVWDVQGTQEIATGGTGEFRPPERGSP